MPDLPDPRPEFPPTSRTPLGEPSALARTPDPGTPGAARLLSIAALVLLGAVVYMQQVARPARSAAPAAPASVAAPSDQFVILSKLVVKLGGEFRKMDPKFGASLQLNVDAGAKTPEDKLRAAVVASELIGVDEATSRLHDLAGAHPDLADDARDLAAAFLAPPDGPTLTRLRERHGYYARLAAARSLPDSDPARQSLVGGGAALLALIVLGMIVGGLVFLVGLVLFIIAVVQVLSRRIVARHVPPAPGGSLGIELVVAFIAGFLALKGLASILASTLKPSDASLMLLTLGAQWLLFLLLLYPRLRYPRSDGLARLGWHRGRGILTEIGCGLLGYLAMLPVFAACVLATLVIVLIRGAVYKAAGQGEPPNPENPVFEMVAKSSGSWLFLLIFALATVWAPVMEETVFRGALYRFLRGRASVVVAAVASALAFGLMHSYEWFLLMPVVGLGFSFALLREWRGSLIAPVTAHALHNGAILLFASALLGILGD